MGLAVRKKEEGFTYGDYLTWPSDERWELINGIAYDMSPAPSRKHQAIIRELSRQMSTYLLDKSCELYFAPFDVRLPEDNETDERIETVVQPDIVIICDQNKLDDKGSKGAPDIAIEILSPYTAKKDFVTKYHLYEKHRVKQYWIIDPETEETAVFKLQDGRYGKPEEYKREDKIQVDGFIGLEIDWSTIFK